MSTHCILVDFKHYTLPTFESIPYIVYIYIYIYGMVLACVCAVASMWHGMTVRYTVPSCLLFLFFEALVAQVIVRGSFFFVLFFHFCSVCIVIEECVSLIGSTPVSTTLKTEPKSPKRHHRLNTFVHTCTIGTTISISNTARS